MKKERLLPSMQRSLQIDQLADQFESHWKASGTPSISTFMEKADNGTEQELLIELVRVDFEYHYKLGLNPNIEEYIFRYPVLNSLPSDQLNELIRHAREVRRKYRNPQSRSNQSASRDDLNADLDEEAPSQSALENDSKSLIGRIIKDRYRITELIGRGGFGNVYRAHDVELGRSVAIKVPRNNLFFSQDDKKRFVREARASANLNHPNVVKVHDIVYDDNLPMIVSEFIEGQTLAALIEQHQLSNRESASIVRGIALGLHFAHEQGLVHRDVKASNVLIDHAGQPYLMDFGLVHFTNPEVTITVDNQLMGTPAYMSPEQAIGDTAAIRRQTDIYSLGIVLYELLTGERPFRGNPQMILHQILNDEPKAPRQLNDSISRDLETICLTAVHKSPAKRYDSAELFAEDLQSCLDGHPIKARPLGRIHRLVRWAKRNPITSALSGTIASGLLVVSIAATIVAITMSNLANSERNANDNLQIQASRTLARQGVFRLQKDEHEGLADLIRSFEAVSKIEDEASSRAIITSAWIDENNNRLAHVTGHSDEVRDVEFSSDGSVFATGSLDGTVRIWDSETGKPLTNGLPHSNSASVGIDRVFFSPNAKWICSIGRDSRLAIWDWRIQKRVTQKVATNPMRLSAAFSPDGKFLITMEHLTSKIHTAIRKIETATWKTIDRKMVEDQPWTSVIFSDDGKFFATASFLGQIKIWNTANLESKSLVSPLENSIKTIAFSPNGKLLAGGGEDDTVCIWNTSDGAMLGDPIKSKDTIRQVAFSPDNRLLAIASYNSNIRFWNLAEYVQHGDDLIHDGPVLTIAFNRNGNYLASGGYGTKVRIWDVENTLEIGAAKQHQSVITKVAFHPTRDIVCSASKDRTARVWNVGPAKNRGMALQHFDRVWSVNFSSTGKKLVTASEEGLAMIWDVDSGTRTGVSFIHHGTLLVARFRPFHNQVATISQETVKLWELKNNQLMWSGVRGGQQLRCAKFSSNGRFLVTGGDSPVAKLYDFQQLPPEITAIDHPMSIKDVAFHPDGNWFATCCDDGIVRFFDVSDCSSLGDSIEHDGDVTAVAFNPDGTLLATASSDMTIRLWHTKNWSPYGQPIYQKTYVNALAFSPNGRLLASANDSGTIQLVDVLTGIACGEEFKLGYVATSVSFDQSGKLLCGGSFDKVAKIWRLPSYLYLKDLDHLRRRVWVALGARSNSRGHYEPVPWKTWQRLRDEMTRKNSVVE